MNIDEEKIKRRLRKAIYASVKPLVIKKVSPNSLQYRYRITRVMEHAVKLGWLDSDGKEFRRSESEEAWDHYNSKDLSLEEG